MPPASVKAARALQTSKKKKRKTDMDSPSSASPSLGNMALNQVKLSKSSQILFKKIRRDAIIAAAAAAKTAASLPPEQIRGVPKVAAMLKIKRKRGRPTLQSQSALSTSTPKRSPKVPKVKKAATPNAATSSTPKKRQHQRSPCLLPKSYYPIDTKGICILCYRERTVLNAKPVRKMMREKFSARFCSLLLRHLKLNLKQNVIPASGPPNSFPTLRRCNKVSVVLCEDCSLLAKNFCDLYSELESVRLKLDACVKSLSDIVRVAGRIPSRTKMYQERMGMDDVVPPGPQRVMAARQLRRKNTAALAQNFRQELLRKSIGYQKLTLPRVKLARIGNASSRLTVPGTTSALANFKLGTPNPEHAQYVFEQFRNFALAYAVTFGSVWLLATLGRKEPSKPVLPFIDNSASSMDIEELIHAHIPSTQSQSPCSVLEETLPTPSVSPVSIEPVPGCSTLDEHELAVGATESQPFRNRSITITDSGKTVLLPHHFKIESTFVDESGMDNEPNYDFVDLTDDDDFDFITADPAASSEDDTPMPSAEQNVNASHHHLPTLIPKEEPQPTEDFINLNDRHCKDCNIYLGSRAELEKHRVLIHKWLCYVQCPVCKQMFPGYHYLKMHRNKTEHCAVDDVDEIRELETIAKPIFPYAPTIRGDKFCPVEACFEVFCNEESLKLHLKAHGSFQCSLCPDQRQFEKAHDLALHEAEEHGGSNYCTGYKCSRCDFHVGGQYQFILHFLDVHLQLGVYKEKCEICQKGFSFLAVGKKAEHFKTHHNLQGKDPSKVFICEICQAPFLRRAQLAEHEIHTHHLLGKKFRCSLCGLELFNQIFVQRHKLLVHDNLTMYEVEAQCKRQQFAQQQRQAMSRKLGGGEFRCGCGKTFAQKYYHTRHVHLVHNGVEPEPTPEINNTTGAREKEGDNDNERNGNDSQSQASASISQDESRSSQDESQEESESESEES